MNATAAKNEPSMGIDDEWEPRAATGIAADIDSNPRPPPKKSGTVARVRAESQKARSFRQLMALDVRCREEIAKLRRQEAALRSQLTEAVKRWLEVYGRPTSEEGVKAHHRFVWEGEVVRPIYRRTGKGRNDNMSGFIQRFPPVAIDIDPPSNPRNGRRE